MNYFYYFDKTKNSVDTTEKNELAKPDLANAGYEWFIKIWRSSTSNKEIKGNSTHYEEDSKVFDYFNEGYPKATQHELKRLHQFLLGYITKPSALVLDIGCGKGWVASSLLPKGYRIISTDISSINPRKVIEAFPSKHHIGLVADAYNLPIENASLDYIVASEIIEHLENPGQFISALFTKLKPGGQLLITTFYKEIIEYNLCIHCNKATPKDAHLHSFTKESFVKTTPKDANFKSKIFMNKWLLKFRSHLFIGFLPFRIWYFIDSIFNFIFGGEKRLFISYQKPIE